MAHHAQSLCQTYHLKALKWNFSATSHGKGSINGIGGTLKRLAWRLVKARKCEVRNAAEFYSAVNNAGTAISTHLISGDEIDTKYRLFEEDMLSAPKVK
jgi:hypothetical protein